MQHTQIAVAFARWNFFIVFSSKTIKNPAGKCDGYTRVLQDLTNNYAPKLTCIPDFQLKVHTHKRNVLGFLCVKLSRDISLNNLTDPCTKARLMRKPSFEAIYMVSGNAKIQIQIYLIDNLFTGNQNLI